MQESTNVRREGYLRENYRLFHLRDTAGQEKDYHFHEFEKVIVLLSGHVQYEVETSTYDLRPWDILLVRHHAIHKANIDVSEPYERIILYIDAKYVQRAAPDDRLLTCFDRTDAPGMHCLRPDERMREQLHASLSRMEEALDDDGFGADILRNTLLLQLLVLINRLIPESPARTRRPNVYDEKIEKTLSYINENLDRELTVEQLAERIYLSRYHFMRLFKEQTGSTVHAYIRRKRLLRAAKLIRSGVPVSRVAADTGYADYSAFYRAFRDCFGASPSDLR